MARELSANLMAVNDTHAIDLLKDSNRFYAFFWSKDILEYLIQRFRLIKYYIPDEREDSVLTVDLIGIAISPDFAYKKQIDRL